MKSAIKYLFLILLSPYVFGQKENTDTLKTYTFDEAVISVNKETELVRNIANEVLILKQKDIEKVNAFNTADVPNVVAALLPNVEFVGNGTKQTFDVGTVYSASEYTVSPNTQVLIDGIVQVGGFSWTNEFTTLNFVSAPAGGSVIAVVPGRMTVSIKNSAAAVANNKLTVLPGLVNSAFSALGFETFVYTQTITSPAASTYARFGSTISVDTGAVNRFSSPFFSSWAMKSRKSWYCKLRLSGRAGSGRLG
jgi:hypothetical protein